MIPDKFKTVYQNIHLATIVDVTYTHEAEKRNRSVKDFYGGHPVVFNTNHFSFSKF